MPDWLFATPWTAVCQASLAPAPRTYSNSCPWSQWCHLTISSSVVPFSSCLQSFPASGTFQMSQFFASGGQSIGVSASTWVLPMNIQDWSPLGWTGWISLQSNGFSRVFSNTTFKSINSSVLSFLYSSTLTSIGNQWKNQPLLSKKWSILWHKQRSSYLGYILVTDAQNKSDAHRQGSEVWSLDAETQSEGKELGRTNLRAGIHCL